MRTKLLGVLAAVALLAGCMTDRGPNESFGTLIGAGLGGLLGSRVGSGTGQLAATAVGTLAGASVGGDVGRSMDKVDILTSARPVGGDFYGSHYRPGPAVLGSDREYYRQRAYDVPSFFSEGNCGRIYENEYRERNEGGYYYRDQRWKNDQLRSARCVQPPAYSDGLRDGGRGRLRGYMEHWPGYSGRSKRSYYHDRW